jgi:hypothetical protein
MAVEVYLTYTYLQQAKATILKVSSKISGFYGGDYEYCRLLGRCAYGSCYNRCFGGIKRPHHQGGSDQRPSDIFLRNVGSNKCHISEDGILFNMSCS